MANEDDPVIKIDLDADSKKLNDSLKKTETKSNRAGKDSGKKFSSGFASTTSGTFTRLAKQMAAIGGAYLSFSMIKRSVAAAKVQEDAVNKLNNALALSGKYSAQASKDMQDLASSIQSQTRYGDEAILQNAALIQSLGSLSNDGLKQATQAAVDLSAALGISLEAASHVVGKAAAGNITSLSRFGIIMKSTGDKGKDFANVLDLINSRYSGAAIRDAKTFSGITDSLSNSFGDFLETVGQVITESPELKAMFILIKEGIDSASRSLSEANLAGRFGFISITILELGKSIQQFFHGIQMFFQTVVASVGSVIISTANLGMKLLGKFSDKAKAISDDIGKLSDDLSMFAQESALDITDADTTGIDNTITRFKELSAEMSKTKDYQNSLADNSNLVNSFGTLETTIQSLSGTWDSEIKSMMKSSEDLSKSAKTSILNGFASSVSSGFAAVGGALARGENAFEAFGKAILGTIGQVAMQMGAAFILQGTGLTFLGSPNGPPLIAAGVGLSVLGGALSAIGGGGASAPTTSAGASDSSYVGDTSSSPLYENIEEKKEEKPQINVTVQGNYMDMQESRLELVRLINESYDLDGSMIGGMA